MDQTGQPSLQAFGPQDAKFFFGRENLTDWLVSDLRREVRAAQGVRFLVVLGPSGSGKSSVMLAGLVPRLIAGAIEGSEHWRIAILRPGRDPIVSLAVALAGLNGAYPSPVAVQELMTGLQASENMLHLTTRLALRDAPSARWLVLLVDQFEEVFTLCRDEATRKAMIDNLVEAANAREGQTVVILTLRTDHYGQCASYPALAAALSDHQVLPGAGRSGGDRKGRGAGAAVATAQPGLHADRGDVLESEGVGMYSKVKASLRRAAARTKGNLYDALGVTLRGVTDRDIIGWFHHAGLCATHG